VTRDGALASVLAVGGAFAAGEGIGWALTGTLVGMRGRYHSCAAGGFHKRANLPKLPTVAWTADQREFVPLLIALYALLPGGKKTKEDPRWVALEEPEMGLHPKAILAVMLLVLELLGRGYRVVLSTHHPLVLDVVWGLQRIRAAGKRGGPARVLEMFGMTEAQGLRGVAEAALEKDYRVPVRANATSRRPMLVDVHAAPGGHLDHPRVLTAQRSPSGCLFRAEELRG
jgi:hypothetical protein